MVGQLSKRTILPLTVAVLWVALLAVIFPVLVEGRGRFFGTGGAVVDDGGMEEDDKKKFERIRNQLKKDLGSNLWKLDRTVSDVGRDLASLSGGRGSAVDRVENKSILRAAGAALKGSTMIRFTTVRDDTRNSKRICLFSTGEKGYWRLTCAPRQKGLKYRGKSQKDANGAEIKESSGGKKFVEAYEEAIIAEPNGIVLEIEVLTQGRQRSRSDNPHAEGPVILYQIPFSHGRLRPDSILNDVSGLVRLLPPTVSNAVEGHRYTQNLDFVKREGVVIGYAAMEPPRGRGLVDPSWARGRRWFFTGRRRGNC